jgi:hypothetical protein
LKASPYPQKFLFLFFKSAFVLKKIWRAFLALVKIWRKGYKNGSRIAPGGYGFRKKEAR